ncbi:MAG: Smr/MutS family protein, partial [Paenibacillaceae bacterium]|nr:Smr/MutS family protein [Paenibacillaceae bacterium]
LEKLEQQRDKRLEKAEEEASAIIAKARQEAERIIADLRRLALEEGAAVKEHKLIAARKELDEAEPQRRKKAGAARKAAKPPQQIEPGDEVMVYSLNQKGHVVELSGSKEAVVQLGIMKMKVSLDDMELIAAAPAASKPVQRTAPNVKRTRDENVRSELDLRGANLEEALIEVDRFIDEAYLSNLGQIYIIHGKGTGILRTGISEYLRKHKHIKSYRLGNYGEGGIGVTVAELK